MIFTHTNTRMHALTVRHHAHTLLQVIVKRIDTMTENSSIHGNHGNMSMLLL